NWMKMSCENQYYLIYVGWKNGKEVTQIHQELVIAEGDHALSVSTIHCWIKLFSSGKKDCKDKPRSGCPREAVTQTNINKVKKFVNDDPHITIHGLVYETGISYEYISFILHNELDMSKKCAKWVPYKLSSDQKKER
ncbi:1542_t:CDS:1, partial [Gigaspora margarita]